MGTLKIHNNREIGERIKFRRQDIQMSQEKLAEILEVSYQQVQRYESGKNAINVERIQQVATALGVRVSYFFEESSEPIAADPSGYFTSSDVKVLLRHFSKVTGKAARDFVITAARLAAKKNE